MQKKKSTAVWEIRNYDISNILVKKPTQFSSCLSECPGKPWHGNSKPEFRDKHA